MNWLNRPIWTVSSGFSPWNASSDVLSHRQARSKGSLVLGVVIDSHHLAHDASVVHCRWCIRSSISGCTCSSLWSSNNAICPGLLFASETMPLHILFIHHVWMLWDKSPVSSSRHRIYPFLFFFFSCHVTNKHTAGLTSPNIHAYMCQGVNILRCQQSR